MAALSLIITTHQGNHIGLPLQIILLDFAVERSFADDIVADAEQTGVSKAELPSENFIMHMLGDGQALLMCVWDKRGEDVRITLSGQGSKRVITGSEIYYGRDPALREPM